MRSYLTVKIIIVLSVLLSACQSQDVSISDDVSGSGVKLAVNVPESAATTQQALPSPTALPTRPVYAPGELVDYIAQTGDTLPALAKRFNTTVEEIMDANSFIPQSATTMPPGMPMKIPIYYLPFWGSYYQIIPDSVFVNGPAMVNFDTERFVAGQPGWLNGYIEYVGGQNRSGAGVVDYVATNFSVSPTLLLALLEYQSGALSNPNPSQAQKTYPLGYENISRKGVYRQLLWAANVLNNAYYEYRNASMLSLEYADERIERFDPWQNAATVSLHNFFNLLLEQEKYQQAIGPQGLALTYQSLFGDVWAQDQPHIPGSLEQPFLTLPFLPGGEWALTGGPHTAWGTGEPFAALDFAPPAVLTGCSPTNHWATAVADGVVARTDVGVVVLDLDGDGDERTGWNILYLHIATEGRARVGDVLTTGSPVGHPSCEGGTSTGTHVHIARKYNGEWILADGVLAFNLEGWIAHNGNRAYLGTLTRGPVTVLANENPNSDSFISADVR